MTRSIRSIQGEALREIAAELDEQRATLESVKELLVQAIEGNTETRGRLLDEADRLGTRVLNVEQKTSNLTQRVTALETVVSKL